VHEADVQPRPEDYDYELDQALAAIVGIKSIVPPDAFTAETLGTERIGNGVLIDDSGLIVTIGYLITEAETVWVTLSGGRAVQGHALGYDHETGFGLVQALARIDTPFLPLGTAASVKTGDIVVVAAAGGRQRSIVAQVKAKQEFAGYWEYVLDEAIFTAPAHPTWSGTALIGPSGELLGIGSLQLQQQAPGRGDKDAIDVNMIVPIDLLKPILEDLKTRGRRAGPPRPWLGLYATEVGNRIVIAGVSGRGPARKADIKPGDIVLSVDGHEVKSLAGFFRSIWAVGDAGVEVPMTLHRNGASFEASVKSTDRHGLFKGPILH
jgi:S1-C subfamily serine protease